ncbi:hypothetical protein VP01_32g5 [Puccinia sorghi]|uniref:Uncharacterized protein n=1 Tax=Puccinia sorghi TaxID=27349 RepID=A0A0L6UXJ3_9BASI|nr:hypothetical protein VP01_32g5 [Puccinia sorghi]
MIRVCTWLFCAAIDFHRENFNIEQQVTSIISQSQYRYEKTWLVSYLIRQSLHGRHDNFTLESNMLMNIQGEKAPWNYTKLVGCLLSYISSCLVTRLLAMSQQRVLAVSQFYLNGNLLSFVQFEKPPKNKIEEKGKESVDLQKLPGSFCCYYKLSPKVIQPSFASQSQCILRSVCQKIYTCKQVGEQQQLPGTFCIPRLSGGSGCLKNILFSTFDIPISHQNYISPHVGCFYMLKILEVIKNSFQRKINVNEFTQLTSHKQVFLSFSRRNFFDKGISFKSSHVLPPHLDPLHQISFFLDWQVQRNVGTTPLTFCQTWHSKNWYPICKQVVRTKFWMVNSEKVLDDQAKTSPLGRTKIFPYQNVWEIPPSRYLSWMTNPPLMEINLFDLVRIPLILDCNKESHVFMNIQKKN